MDGQILTGGVLIMKKLLISSILALGIQPAFAVPDSDIVCPQITTCVSGSCSFASPTPNLIWLRYAPGSLIPADKTYNFVKVQSLSLYQMTLQPDPKSYFAKCYYQSSVGDVNTTIILFGFWRPSSNIAYYPDTANSRVTWKIDDSGLSSCDSLNSTDCLMQPYHY